MAQKTLIVLEDDIDGGEATETLTFALDGTAYEIDLNDENATALREAFATWIGHARRSGRSGKARAAVGPKRRRGVADVADIRAWGTENGYKVNARGRVSADLREAYDAAH